LLSAGWILRKRQQVHSYEPFGATSSSGAESDNPFQFTGRETVVTGLQYNRVRYYNPATAGFISQDPAGFAESGTNFYWYANGDPLNYVDPTGESGVVVPIPYPMSVLEDAGDQIGEWVSDAPGVVSEFLTPDERGPFESDPMLDVLCEKRYQEWGIEYYGPGCEETGDSTDPEGPPALVPGANPQHPVPVEPSATLPRPTWTPRPTPFPVPSQ
jgi:RHS repeat-associated protein